MAAGKIPLIYRSYFHRLIAEDEYLYDNHTKSSILLTFYPKLEVKSWESRET